MDKSGFVPAWMKITSSDKTNFNQKFNVDRSNRETEQIQKKSNEQTILKDIDTQSENFFLFQSRNSSKTFGKNFELNNNEHLINDKNFHSKTKSNENKFQRFEKDFPSLNGRNFLSNNNEQPTVWNNAASKFRLSDNENRFFARKNRFLSASNNINLNSPSITNELQTNDLSKSTSTKQKILLLSVPETNEEKEFLIQMGWNDDMTYEITDKDQEEYENRVKLLPKKNNRSARLMLALHRRSLPCVNIRDFLQFEMIDLTSDDESSND